MTPRTCRTMSLAYLIPWACMELKFTTQGKAESVPGPFYKELFCLDILSTGAEWRGDYAVRPFRTLAVSPGVKATHNIGA